MFAKVLVPLDGSELSTRAVEPAVALARKFEAGVILLRVLAPEENPVAPQPAGVAYAGTFEHAAQLIRRDAEGYLHGVRAEWHHTGVPIGTRVIPGAPARVIIDVARAEGVDLIVMSTRGRSGMDRWIYGSIAEAVLRGTDVPVMLIPVRG